MRFPFFLLALSVIAVDSGAASHGLHVGPDGALLKDGQPYRGVGINYFSVFSRMLQDETDMTWRDGLRDLSERKIPFIRFMAGGFWPNEWTLYREDRDEYFRRFDLVVREAETLGIGLIPSLFWHTATVPDLVDEPRNAWGGPESRSIAFMRTYTREVVGRYVDSPAVWAWEFGNEYNLAADLPNAADHRPWVVPDRGTPESRSAADDLTHDMIVTAFRLFAEEVRAVDSYRAITTGNSIPRSSQHHMRTEASWARDTREEFVANLRDVTPAPMDLISVHVYPETEEKRFGEAELDYAELLRLVMEAAAQADKAVFVGEFGAPDNNDAGIEGARENTAAILDAIVKSGVPLAALWVYDLPHQDSFVNITPTNARSYQLDMIVEANKQLR